MKIPPNDSSKKIGANDNSEAVIVRKREQTARPEATGQERADQVRSAKAQANGTDQIHIGLGRYINDYLDPAKLESQSRSRVAELKQLIESGQYSVDSNALATKVANVLSEEVSVAKLLGDDTEEDQSQE